MDVLGRAWREGTFGTGLKQPNFALRQYFLLARMSSIMVVVFYCIYIYIQIQCSILCISIYIYIYIYTYILYILKLGWLHITIYSLFTPTWEATLVRKFWIRKYFPIFMKYITGGYVGEEEAGTRLFQVLHDPKCTKSGVYLGDCGDCGSWRCETYHGKVERLPTILFRNLESWNRIIFCGKKKHSSFLWYLSFCDLFSLTQCHGNGFDMLFVELTFFW